MSIFNAPPDQINGLTLTFLDTLNVGEGGTVSNVDDAGVINVDGGAANATKLEGGTLNLNGGTITGTTGFGTLNLNDGTAVDTNLDIASHLNISGGTIDGITFDGSDVGALPFYKLQLKDFNSLQGTLGFDGNGGPGYDVVFVFQNLELSSATMTANTITINYGQNQSVTYKYTTDGASVVQVQVDGNILDVKVIESSETAPAPAFSAQSAATIVYTAEFGFAPSATELDTLVQFAQAQYTSALQSGASDPAVNVYEALGFTLASTAAVFQGMFGPFSPAHPDSPAGDALFVADAYASVFGQSPNSEQIQHFVRELDQFETLYATGGAFGSPSAIDLLARGTVYGQMLGIEQELKPSTPIGSTPGGTTYTAPPTQTDLVLHAGDVLDVTGPSSNGAPSAINTTVNSGAVVNVLLGGQAAGSLIFDGGVENVSGISEQPIIAGGVENVQEGPGFVEHPTLESGVLKLFDPGQLHGPVTLDPTRGFVIDFVNTQVTQATVQQGPSAFQLDLTYSDHETITYHGAIGGNPSKHFAVSVALQADGNGGTNLIISTHAQAAEIQSKMDVIGIQHQTEHPTM